MFDIVMSLFNKEAFVGVTLDAVLAQSFADWRLIVVDDGSTDRSSAIVRGYADPRITLIEQENRGVGPARNAGIAAATSDWIAFLDADDVWNGDHLAELDALRSGFPDAVLVGCGFERFSGAPPVKPISDGSPARRLSRYFAECARGRQPFFTSSAAVRRSAIAEIGNFKPLPGNEDVELWARLALHGPVAVSDKRTVNYRTGTGGLTDLRASEGSKPLRRDQLSSTIPTLTERLSEIRDPRLRRDVVRYMDSRIGIRLVAAVLEGDFGYARQLAELYERPPRGKARVAASIARLPAPAARIVLKAGRRLQAIVRGARG